jgi:lysine biosynthesis protein LysW
VKETFCPECDHRLKVGGRPFKGQRLHCPECEVNLVVTSLNPLEVEAALAHSKPKANTMEVACPECDAFIKLSVRSRKGQQTVCPTCQTTLEVVTTNPLELDIALPTSTRRHRHRAGER